MKNVTIYFALALVLVLGTDAVYGQSGQKEFPFSPEKQREVKKPSNYWEEILETRRVFGMASEALTTKKQQDFLAVCQKAREAGLFNRACRSFRNLIILRACGADPFYSKEGRRDGQIRCHMIAVRAYFTYLDASNAYRKVSRRTTKADQARVIVAVLNVLGKDYTVDNYKKGLGHGPGPRKSGLGDFRRYVPVLGVGLGCGNYGQKMKAWKTVFIRLSRPGQFRAYTPVPIMTNRIPIGQDANGMSWWDTNGESVTTDAFKFLQRQEEQIWQDILNPPTELRERLPRYTYWKRDADHAEPALVLRALQWVLPDRALLCNWGSRGPCSLRRLLSNSFLKGLCPEWRRELDDFEKSLPSEGSHGRRSIDDRKWWDQMRTGEEILYRKYFAKERLKWRRVSASQYDEARAEQEKWLGSNSSPSFLYKLRLCNVAEWICCQPRSDDGDGASATLDMLERGQVGLNRYGDVTRARLLVSANIIPGCKLKGLVEVARSSDGNLLIVCDPAVPKLKGLKLRLPQKEGGNLVAINP